MMKNNKLKIVTRIIVAVCGLCLIAVLFTPIWRIDLNAPQYPEGLNLLIYANDIKGNVDIINGLNHYIGMKTLHKQDFPEFTILPYCVMFFAFVFMLAAIINRKKVFYTVFSLFVIFGIVAMADFWNWEYNYGHNLDPHAAIIVPGMAYQPPLIGYKQLLNFAAYSIPDIGGWIFIGSGALLLFCVVLENFSFVKSKKINISMNHKIMFVKTAVIVFSLLCLASCSRNSEPISIGKDNCAYCKMTISDARFGAEIVTSTGKVYKFDDIKCLKSFHLELVADQKKNLSFYLADFCGDHQLVDINNCFLLRSDELKCPMNGHLASFKNMDSLEKVKQSFAGDVVNLVLQ